MNLSDLGAGGIKSIQRGTSSVTTADVNITVSAVNMAKSMLLVDKDQVIGGGSTSTSGGVIAVLTSGTNIQLQRASSSVSLRVAWQLVEFK